MPKTAGINWQAGAMCALVIALFQLSHIPLAAAVPKPADALKHQSAPVPASATELESRSRQFVTDYYAAISGDSETALAFIRQNYATDVSFFGRRLDAEGVAERRAKLFELWPQREYQPSPGSIKVICNRVSLQCRVQTIVDWTLANRDLNRMAMGIERVVLVIAHDGERPVIVFEGGETLSR